MDKPDSMYIVLGAGGTDLLDLTGFGEENITTYTEMDVHLNSVPADLTNSAEPDKSGEHIPGNIDFTKTSDMAIYGGTSFDVVTLNDGQRTYEFYLHGIEQIHLPGYLSANIILSEEQSNLNQTQWNLQVMDVPGAWRFGKGGDTAILVSLDDGLSIVPNPEIDHAVNQTPEYSSYWPSFQ